MNKKTLTTIVVTLSLSLILSPVAIPLGTMKRAQAQGGPFDPINAAANIASKVEEGWQTVKEIGLDKIAKVAALRVLKGLVADTINWANQGFHGEPLFLRDEQNFLVRIENEQIVNLVKGFKAIDDSAGGGNVPYWRQVSRAIVTEQTNELSDQVVSTFENDTGISINTFQSNFNQGGWDAFLSFTQGEANNPIDFHTNVTNAIDRRIQEAVSTLESDIQSGDGFISMRECKRYKDGTESPEDQLDKYSFSSFGASFAGATEANCAQWAKTTPGSAVADQVFGALATPTDQTGQVDEVTDVLTNVLFVLFDNLTRKGLAALTSSSSSSSSTNDAGLNLQAEVANILGTGGGAGGSGNSNTSVANSWLENPDILINLETELETAIELVGEEIIVLEDIRYTLNEIPKRAQLLDHCILGPDLRWEERLRDEYDRRSEKLIRNANKDNNNADAAADKLIRQKDILEEKITEIELAMIDPRLTLSGTVIWLDMVRDTDNLSSTRRRYEERRVEKRKLQAYLMSVLNRYYVLSESAFFLQQKLANQQSELAALEQELLSVQAEYDNENSQYTNTQSQIQQLQTQVQQGLQVQGFLEEEAAATAPTSLSTQGTSSTQTTGGNNVTNQLVQNKSQVTQQQNNLYSLQTQVTIDQSKNIRLQRLREQITKLEAEIETLKADIRSTQNAIEQALLKAQNDSGKSAQQIIEEERQEVKEMIQRFLSIQQQVTKPSTIHEMEAEAAKFREFLKDYTSNLEACKDERAALENGSLMVKWQNIRSQTPFDLNLGLELVKADEQKKLFCNAPRYIFRRDDSSGFVNNVQWFQILPASYNACRSFPDTDNDGTPNYEDAQHDDGYYECSDNNDANDKDDLILPSNYICADIGCGDPKDIFAGWFLFWKKEVTDFPKDMSCSGWYRASLSTYTGAGGFR